MDVILKPDRQRSLERRHPWIFSGAVAKTNGEPSGGEIVTIKSADGKFLAYAGWSPKSQIVGRVWSFNEADAIDAKFLLERLQASIGRRATLLESGETNAARLIHAESDGLPGLIVDQYADVLVVQLLTAGIERWRDTIVETLRELTSCTAIFERSDAEVRELEGLPPRSGALFGAAPTEPIEIQEHGVKYFVDVVTGQKTGFYLDQRDNRKRVMDLAKGKKVLNVFCYTGGFSIGALREGAKSVLSIDSSESALVLAQKNHTLNGFTEDQATWWEGDVFQALRTLRDKAEQFDLIILDPPKFAPTASHAEKASRAYKDINLLALKLLSAEGLLVTFSCSGGVNADLFQKIVAGAAVDAKVDAQIIARLGASADHPASVHFPEGEYLKGLILKKL